MNASNESVEFAEVTARRYTRRCASTDAGRLGRSDFEIDRDDVAGAAGHLFLHVARRFGAADWPARVTGRRANAVDGRSRPLGEFFGTTSLRHITPEQIAAYQNARIDAGRAPKTVNGELSVLRQVRRHARLWYRFQEDYRSLKNTKPPVGQALTDDEQKRLFEAARSRPEWIFAYVASALAFYCGLRACEIRGLQWKHVDWDKAQIQIRRSKTPTAGAIRVSTMPVHVR